MKNTERNVGRNVKGNIGKIGKNIRKNAGVFVAMLLVCSVFLGCNSGKNAWNAVGDVSNTGKSGVGMAGNDSNTANGVLGAVGNGADDSSAAGNDPSVMQGGSGAAGNDPSVMQGGSGTAGNDSDDSGAAGDASDMAGDSDTEKDAGMKIGKETQFMPGITEMQPQYYQVKPGQLCEMGEAVGAMDVQNGKVVADALLYTISKATLFEDLEAAGIQADAAVPFETEDLVDGNGELKPGVKLLMVELTVQNACADPERNITGLDILCAEDGSISPGDGEVGFYELFPSEPVYFSNPTGKKVGDDWKDYYYYRLPVGQSKNLKVAWYVDTEQFDPENLYLTFGSEEYQRYVKIVF